MTEIWQDAPGYEKVYQVSNMGNIKSLARVSMRKGKRYPQKEIMMKPSLASTGYLQVSLYKEGKPKIFMVHQLVAMSFLGHVPDGKGKTVINHLDQNRLNNRLHNLELCDIRRNTTHSIDKSKTSSKYTGVTLNGGRWRAQISINNKTKHLGYYLNEKDAAHAYHLALNEQLQVHTM